MVFIILLETWFKDSSTSKMSDADVPTKKVLWHKEENMEPIKNDRESISLSNCHFNTPIASLEEDPVNDFVDNLSFTPFNSFWNLSSDDEGEKSKENYFSRNDKSGIYLENPDEPLYTEAKVSNVEAFILILSFIVRFNLSKTFYYRHVVYHLHFTFFPQKLYLHLIKLVKYTYIVQNAKHIFAN